MLSAIQRRHPSEFVNTCLLDKVYMHMVLTSYLPVTSIANPPSQLHSEVRRVRPVNFGYPPTIEQPTITAT